MINPETPTPPADLYRPAVYAASALALDGLLALAGNYDLEVWERLENNRAGILTGNHEGIMDIPLIGAATRRVYKGRNLRYLLKDDLVKDYRHSDKVASYFEKMGGNPVDISNPITEQPAWDQLLRDIANNQLICSFNQKGVLPGKRPRRIGPLAVKTNTAVQPVGMAGTEGNREAWLGPKVVVYGKVLEPGVDPASIDPKDRRSWAKHASTFSAEVDAMTQAVAYRAHQVQSRKIVPINGLRR